MGEEERDVTSAKPDSSQPLDAHHQYQHQYQNQHQHQYQHQNHLIH